MWPIALASAEHSTETINFIQLREAEIQSAELKDSSQEITQIKAERKAGLLKKAEEDWHSTFDNPTRKYTSPPPSPPGGGPWLPAIGHSTKIPQRRPLIKEKLCYQTTPGHLYSKYNNLHLNIGHTVMTSHSWGSNFRKNRHQPDWGEFALEPKPRPLVHQVQ